MAQTMSLLEVDDSILNIVHKNAIQVLMLLCVPLLAYNATMAIIV